MVAAKDLKPEVLDLNRIIDNVLELLEIQLLHTSYDIRFFRHSRPLFVEINQIELEQVLLNIIRNAIDEFSEERE
jgi:C4-dicarboxylate-specific signal transduction histidine kinase